MSDPVLSVENLEITYRMNDAPDVTAVSNCSFAVENGEYYGLVGESGCGKSTVAKSIVGALDANGEITGGEIRFEGTPIHEYTEAQYRRDLRWTDIAVIPQASMNSLDPITKISDQAVEIGQTHTNQSRAAIRERLADLFEVVGLSESRVDDYPHQFSGGMEQRAVIAFALLLEPSLIIADEPTTALDVIMQDEILAYFDEIKDGDFSMLMITHDMSVVLENCDSMAVLHGGQTAESGSVTAIHDDPRHPYTKLLQEAFPDIRYPDRELMEISGNPPELTGNVDYCTFADRCPWAVEDCRQAAPSLEPTGADGTHQSSCLRRNEVDTFDTVDAETDSAPIPDGAGPAATDRGETD
jgi:oligopeptide/dipeptide ABC transporter ATP-binding protein